MPKTLKISIGLFILGIIGFFYISELCVEYSIPWYAVMIVSLVMITVGVVLLWVNWGGKKKREQGKPRDD